MVRGIRLIETLRSVRDFARIPCQRIYELLTRKNILKKIARLNLYFLSRNLTKLHFQTLS